ncbi:MAG: helix-turn-helix transcriptional regulator [Candidatus Latescibacteria bacterium]|jgi:transcriptional regulator with XRE-family HTH domain|nr:helix-turn-helix transcriptional regulator [Candidatus Latescibacterota bacterium]
MKARYASNKDLFKLWVDWLMKDRHMTKEAIARELKISYSHFSNISSGNRNPGTTAINKILRYLDMDINTYSAGPSDIVGKKPEVIVNEKGEFTNVFMAELYSLFHKTSRNDKTKGLTYMLISSMEQKEVEEVFDFVQSLYNKRIKKSGSSA